ncbi:MAG TPA: hypothetical protein VF043_18230 [Ktedonobacteraceae bacterium]
MKTTMKKFLATKRFRFLAVGFVVVAMAVVVLSGLVARPTASHASAYGIQYWGVHVVHGVYIPSGQLAHYISGNGLYVTWDGANFISAGNLCDVSMRFTYGNGRLYLNGGMHWGCSHVGQWKYWIKRFMPRGSACAELWEHNWRILVARQCHYVY